MAGQKLPYVKVCCIKSWQEAALAVRYGASAIGLVSAMPSGPGVISEVQIKEILLNVPAGIKTFLLTSHTDPQKIIAQHRHIGTTTIQLVDAVKVSDYTELRKQLPGVELVQVVHVQGERSILDAITFSKVADMLLLDSGNPGLKIKELGGTGKVHDWSVSREIVQSVNIPVFLAGGLKPENVRSAIREVRPYGLDLCSGVRTQDRLDQVKLEAFFKQLRVD